MIGGYVEREMTADEFGEHLVETGQAEVTWLERALLDESMAKAVHGAGPCDESYAVCVEAQDRVDALRSPAKGDAFRLGVADRVAGVDSRVRFFPAYVERVEYANGFRRRQR